MTSKTPNPARDMAFAAMQIAREIKQRGGSKERIRAYVRAARRYHRYARWF